MKNYNFFCLKITDPVSHMEEVPGVQVLEDEDGADLDLVNTIIDIDDPHQGHLLEVIPIIKIK